MKVATSLAERDYFYGLSALINSMVHNGTYFNKLVVGYRGKLPGWLPQLKRSKNGQSFKNSEGFEVEFVEMNGDFHMVHEKPNWLNHLITVLEPEADEYCFFDSDLIILNRMSFFGEWMKKGVALCEDVNGDMPDNHPVRLEWKKMVKAEGHDIKNIITRYYNSGFIGWRKENSGFIKEWGTAFDILSKLIENLKITRLFDRSYPVLSANQDSLNVACMITNCPLTTIGREAMGFDYGLKLMAHPIGERKPWNRTYFFDFFKGISPEAVDLYFWHSVNSVDVKPYSNLHVKMKIYTCLLLRGLSRFYRRK